MSGWMPCFQIWRPSRVSHSIVPTSRAEPSLRLNCERTVPVPNVFSPISCPAWRPGSRPRRSRPSWPCRCRPGPPAGRSVAVPPGLTAISLIVAAAVLLAIDVAVLEELAGHPDRLVDVAAGIAAQVEDQRRRAGLAGRGDHRDQLVGRVGRELLDPDVGDLRAGISAQLTDGTSTLARTMLTSIGLVAPACWIERVTVVPASPRILADDRVDVLRRRSTRRRRQRRCRRRSGRPSRPGCPGSRTG